MGRRPPENAKEWLMLYERRYQRAYDNLMATGMQKYDRQTYEYSCVCDAFRALLREREKHSNDIRQRTANKDWVVKNLLHHTYTRREVIDLLSDAVYW